MDYLFDGPIRSTVLWVSATVIGYGLVCWVCWTIGQGGTT